MDLDRLKYFKAVAETVNIRKAAELLSLTPSALSKAVKQLESDLGARLITAEGRGIALTADGKIAYRLACRLLDGYEEFLTGFEQRQVEDRPVRIGSFSTFTTYFLGAFAKKEWPDARLHVKQLMPGEIEQALVDQVIDVGMTYVPMPREGVKYLKAAKTTVELYARKGAFKGVDPKDVPMVAPITPITGTVLDARGFDGWPTDYFQRRVKYQIEGLEAALAMTRQGLCAGFFPSFLVKLHNAETAAAFHLEPLPLPFKLRPQVLTLYLVRRSSDDDDAVTRKLARALRQAQGG